MNVGELVLNLGIKGADKTVGALGNVKKGLSETASMSLEAKAGIIAAMYALERLFATSGKAGTSLTNFNSLTGQSVQMLQQYQYAARQVGVSNEEVEGSFKTLQASMTKTLMNQGAPSGLARVAQLTGTLAREDIDKFAKSPQLLIQRLQEYAKKETNIGLRNETLKSFGLGENMISALSRNAFRPEVLKKAPTYSDNEIGKLDKANIAWSNLGNKVEMAVGHFNALHGGQLVTDISKIVDQVIRLAEAFTKIAEKLHLFEAIGKAFEGWNIILGGVNSAVDKISGAVNDPKQKDSLIEETKDGAKNILGYMGYLGKSLADNILPPTPEGAPQKALASLPSPSVNRQSITPSMRNTSVAGNSQTNHVTVQNTFQNVGADPKKIMESVKQSVSEAVKKGTQKPVRDAHRQMSAQVRST